VRCGITTKGKLTRKLDELPEFFVEGSEQFIGSDFEYE